MKALLLVLTIFAFSVNSFAKEQKKSPKGKYKFDINVYYKLKFPDRQKYLQLYVDFVKEIGKDGKIAQKADLDLMQLLFPTADAADGVCLTGGIYYTPPCGALRSTEFPDEIKSVFSGCTSGNRCAAYFGLDASGNGLCYDTQDNATKECQGKSSPEAIQRLNGALANQFDPKARALQKALDIDLKNDLIETHCLSKSSKKGACARLASAVETYRSKAGATGAAAPPDAGNLGGKGCIEAEVQALESTGKGAGKGLNRLWYQMLKSGAIACGAPSFTAMQQKMGVCEINDSDVVENVERDLRSGDYDNLLRALNTLENGKPVNARSDEWKSFTYYMGITPDEFKRVFCAKDTSAAAEAGLGVTKSAAGIGTEDFGKLTITDHTNRRDAFKNCVKEVFKKQTVDGADVKAIYTSNRRNSVCQFKSAKFDPADITGNTAKYTGGKYYLSDNKTGQCYALERAGTDCNSMGNLTERQKGGVYDCKAKNGSTSLPTFYRLKPINGGDTSPIVKEGDALLSSFSFQEYDCGGNFKHCGIDNNYCKDENGASPIGH